MILFCTKNKIVIVKFDKHFFPHKGDIIPILTMLFFLLIENKEYIKNLIMYLIYTYF